VMLTFRRGNIICAFCYRLKGEESGEVQQKRKLESDGEEESTSSKR
jgi:hypothetical protein